MKLWIFSAFSKFKRISAHSALVFHNFSAFKKMRWNGADISTRDPMPTRLSKQSNCCYRIIFLQFWDQLMTPPELQSLHKLPSLDQLITWLKFKRSHVKVMYLLLKMLSMMFSKIVCWRVSAPPPPLIGSQATFEYVIVEYLRWRAPGESKTTLQFFFLFFS